MITIEDIKGSVVAHRNDRMGARIIAMLNALRVAKDYDLSFTCGWTTGGRTSEEVRDPTNIFTQDYVDAFFFDNDILGRVYDDLIDLSTIQNAPGDPKESDFRQRALNGSAYLCGAAMGVTVLPWEDEAEVAARLPRGLEHMQFSPPVAKTIRQIEEVFAGKRLIAYHIRRGDIISDPIASNKLWPNKFIPRELYEVHLERTLEDPAAQVLVFSDTPVEVERLKAKSDRVQGITDLLGERDYTSGARDFLELYAMSRCKQIYGPPSSAFSQTAMTIGGCTLDAVQDALSPEDQAYAMDLMTERLEAKSDLFLNMGDVGQCLHFLNDHLAGKGEGDRAKRIIRAYMEDGLDKSFAYQLLCELSVEAGELEYCERVRDLAYARPVYVDDSMAYANTYSAIYQLTQGNWATAMARLQAAIWFRPLEPMVHGALNLGLTAGVVNPRDFYPFDTNLIREKGAVFPPGKKALGQLNAFAPKGHDPGDRSAFHPWDLVVRDWRLSMGKRLNRAYTNKSKIQKNHDMLERSFAKTHAGTPALTSALAVLNRGMGRLDEALEQQRQVVAQEPDVAIYRKRLSDVLYEKGNDKMGLFQLEKGYELSEGHPCFAAELGWRWWKIKEKREDCIRLFADLAGTDHGFVELHFMTADMLRRKDAHIELALEQIDKGIAQGHGHQRMMTTKARILMLLGRTEEAKALYENIVEWGQGTEHTHVEIYRQFKALGQVDTAKALTGRSIYDFEMVKEMAGD